MTKKEAAQKLYNILHDDMFSWTQESVDAFNIAIPVLIAQESNTNQHIQRVESVDCISRQTAIDRINKQREHLQPDIYPQDKIGDAAYRICAEFIELLPPAQPEPQWILCSERLPEVRYDALGNWLWDEVILLMNGDKFMHVRNGHFNPIGMFEVEDEDGPAAVGTPVKDVIAWMPLP